MENVGLGMVRDTDCCGFTSMTGCATGYTKSTGNVCFTDGLGPRHTTCCTRGALPGVANNPLCDANIVNGCEKWRAAGHSCSTVWQHVCPGISHPSGTTVTLAQACPGQCATTCTSVSAGMIAPSSGTFTPRGSSVGQIVSMGSSAPSAGTFCPTAIAVTTGGCASSVPSACMEVQGGVMVRDADCCGFKEDTSCAAGHTKSTGNACFSDGFGTHYTTCCASTCVTCPSTTRCPTASQTGLTCAGNQRCEVSKQQTCGACGAARCEELVVAPCVACPAATRCAGVAGDGGLTCAVSQRCVATGTSCTVCGTAVCAAALNCATDPLSPGCLVGNLPPTGTVSAAVVEVPQAGRAFRRDGVLTSVSGPEAGQAVSVSCRSNDSTLFSTPPTMAVDSTTRNASLSLVAARRGSALVTCILLDGGSPPRSAVRSFTVRVRADGGDDDDDQLSDAAVAAIVIGSILLFLLLLLALWLAVRNTTSRPPPPPLRSYSTTAGGTVGLYPPPVYSPTKQVYSPTKQVYSPTSMQSSLAPVFHPIFEPGQPVSAQYLNGEWYDATVAGRAPDGTYTVQWYDGSISDAIPPSQVQPA